MKKILTLGCLVILVSFVVDFISAKLTLADEPGRIHELELTEEQLRRMT